MLTYIPYFAARQNSIKRACPKPMPLLAYALFIAYFMRLRDHVKTEIQQLVPPFIQLHLKQDHNQNAR